MSGRHRGQEVQLAREHGLIHGILLKPQQPAHELTWDELDAAMDDPEALVWLHFNAANAHARQWITHCARLPEVLQDFLFDYDDRKRLEEIGKGIVGVISDVHYGFDFDPEQIALLRFYLDSHCLISTRRQPLSATDALRNSIRGGLRFDRTVPLVMCLLKFQAETLENVATRLGREVGDIEDQILAGRIHDQRSQLGKIRRLAVRIHRHFAPEHRALQRLCVRRPAWFTDSDKRDLQDNTEAFGDAVNDLDVIQERAKLLQEELAARMAESTNKNLFILSMVTAIFMPATLITGIFGMNVAGLPGLDDASAFWWVMFGIAAVAVVSLVLLHLKRLF